MGFVDDIIEQVKPRKRSDHVVIISFEYGMESDEPYYNCSEELAKIVEASGVGLYDGHEIAIDHTDGSYFIYGSNAEEIYKTIEPILLKYSFMKGAIAYLKFGSLDSSAHELELIVMK